MNMNMKMGYSVLTAVAIWLFTQRSTVLNKAPRAAISTVKPSALISRFSLSAIEAVVVALGERDSYVLGDWGVGGGGWEGGDEEEEGEEGEDDGEEVRHDKVDR